MWPTNLLTYPIPCSLVVDWNNEEDAIPTRESPRSDTSVSLPSRVMTELTVYSGESGKYVIMKRLQMLRQIFRATEPDLLLP